MPTKPTRRLTQNNFFLAALLYARGFPPFRFRSSRFPHSLAVVQSSGRLRRGSNPCRACIKKIPPWIFFRIADLQSNLHVAKSPSMALYCLASNTTICCKPVMPNWFRHLKIFPKLSVHKLKIFCGKKHCKACKKYFQIKSYTFDYLVYSTEI